MSSSIIKNSVSDGAGESASGGLAEHSQTIAYGLIGLLIVSAVTAFVMNRRDSQSDVSRDALYLAEKAIQTDTQKLADASKPADAQASKVADTSKDKAKTPPAPSVDFKKLDVNATYANAIGKLKDVSEKYGNTRAAFEARLKLGDLYYNHGHAEDSIGWYEKAVDSAPDSLGKSLAYSSLAYGYENSGKHKEAADAYQKALNQGEAAVKGDALLGLARNYVALQDMAKARSTYDQISKDLPNTEYAKTAETLKAQLK